MRKLIFSLIVLLVCAVCVSAETYFYAGSQALAIKHSSQDLEYVHSDRLGSNTQSDTLPYGKQLAGEHRFSFTGKENDGFDVVYFGARYYDADLGLFTSIDPVEGELAYGYVLDNPLNLVDAHGAASGPSEELLNSEYLNIDTFVNNHHIDTSKLENIPMGSAGFSRSGMNKDLVTLAVADCLIVCGYAEGIPSNYFLWHAPMVQTMDNPGGVIFKIQQRLYAGKNMPEDKQKLHVSVFVNPNFLAESRTPINYLNDLFAFSETWVFHGFYELGNTESSTGVGNFHMSSSADASSGKPFDVTSFLQEGVNRGAWLAEFNSFEYGQMAYLYYLNDVYGAVPLMPGRGSPETRADWNSYSDFYPTEAYPPEILDTFPGLKAVRGY